MALHSLTAHRGERHTKTYTYRRNEITLITLRLRSLGFWSRRIIAKDIPHLGAITCRLGAAGRSKAQQGAPLLELGAAKLGLGATTRSKAHRNSG